MDPFGSLPTQLDPQGEALTAHCEYCGAPGCFRIDLTSCQILVNR